MSENMDKQKWLQKLYRRIVILRETKPFTIKMGGEDFYKFDLGEKISSYDRGISVDVEPVGLKIDGNLIGMTGFYYNPKAFGAENVAEVIESWQWFIEKLKVDEEEFATAIDTFSVLALLVTQIDEGTAYYFLLLITDLHKLSLMGADVSQKISEIGKKVRSHIRKYENLKKANFIKALLSIRDMWYYLFDVSSESSLARFAKENGYSTKLSKHPDLVIENKAFEVKRLRKSLLNNKTASLTNPIRRGLKQKADVIAIEVNNLEKRKIKGFKVTWFARDKLRKVLENAIRINQKGKCVLLFLGTNQGYFGRIVLLKRIKSRLV
jgi:hypothetical protein